MDAVENAKSATRMRWHGDVATCYSPLPEIRPSDPHWPDRDRFILSAGHGSMLLYSLLYLLGVEA